jgi:hypothetical protein
MGGRTRREAKLSAGCTGLARVDSTPQGLRVRRSILSRPAAAAAVAAPFANAPTCNGAGSSGRNDFPHEQLTTFLRHPRRMLGGILSARGFRHDVSFRQRSIEGQIYSDSRLPLGADEANLAHARVRRRRPERPHPAESESGCRARPAQLLGRVEVPCPPPFPFLSNERVFGSGDISAAHQVGLAPRSRWRADPGNRTLLLPSLPPMWDVVYFPLPAPTVIRSSSLIHSFAGGST